MGAIGNSPTTAHSRSNTAVTNGSPLTIIMFIIVAISCLYIGVRYITSRKKKQTQPEQNLKSLPNSSTSTTKAIEPIKEKLETETTKVTDKFSQ